MRISDWSSDVCSSDLTGRGLEIAGDVSLRLLPTPAFSAEQVTLANLEGGSEPVMARLEELRISIALLPLLRGEVLVESVTLVRPDILLEVLEDGRANRSEEHTSELQSLLRIAYAVFCSTKQKNNNVYRPR